MYIIYLVLGLGIWPWPYPAIVHLAEDAPCIAILQGKISGTKHVMQLEDHQALSTRETSHEPMDISERW